MGLIRVLVAAHPTGWRERYGDEFAALLEDTRLTPQVVADVLVGAARLRVLHHRRGLFILAVLLVSVAGAAAAKLTGQAPNILWLPRSVPSALLLVGVLAPWFALTISLSVRRTRPRGTG